MKLDHHLIKIEELILEQSPAPIGNYTLYAENNNIELKASKHTKNKEAVIARLTAQDINSGLNAKQWYAIKIKIMEFIKTKIL